MSNPQVIILPPLEGANPARITDFGNASLGQVLDYCNRVLQWPKVHLPLVDRQPAAIGDLLESTIRRASFDYHSPVPDGITVRRVIMGTAVIAIYSKEDGTIVGNAIEAVEITPELESLIDEYDDDEDGYEYDEEEYEDDELDDEDLDDEDLDEEDLDDGDLDDEDEDLDDEEEDEDLDDEDLAESDEEPAVDEADEEPAADEAKGKQQAPEAEEPDEGTEK